MLPSRSRGLLRVAITLFTSPLFGAFTFATSLVNVTVDDTFGNSEENLQITYQPDGSWSQGVDCTNCEAHLDTTKVHSGTWHDTTYFSDNPPSSPLSASLTFNGVAIYVYCIVTRASTDPFGNSDMTFYLDGDQVGTFVQPPNGDPTYQYSVPVYVNEAIPSGKHTFTLVNGRAGGQTALALLDYIVFSREDTSGSGPTTTTSSSSASPSTSVTSSIGSSPPSVSPSTSVSSTAKSSIGPSPSSAPPSSAPPSTAISSTQSSSSSALLSTPTSAATGNQSNSSMSTAVIAGTTAVVVLLVVLAAGLLAYCVWRRRRRRTYEKAWMSEAGSTAGSSGASGAHWHRALPPTAEPARSSFVPDPYVVSLPPTSPVSRKGAPLSPSTLAHSRESEYPSPTTAQSNSSLFRVAVPPNSPSFDSVHHISPTACVSSEPVPREGPWTTASAFLERTQARGDIHFENSGGPGIGAISIHSRASTRDRNGGEGTEIGEEGPPSYAAAVTAGRDGVPIPDS